MKKFLLPMVLIAGLIIFFTTDLKNTFSFAGLATNYSVITTFVTANQLASWLGFMLLYTVVVALSLRCLAPDTGRRGSAGMDSYSNDYYRGKCRGLCGIYRSQNGFCQPVCRTGDGLYFASGSRVKRMPFLICWPCG